MQPSVAEHNQRFLDQHQVDYPYSIQLKRGSVNPKVVQFHLFEVAFICAPLPDYTEWRFKTEEGLRAFSAHYATEDTRLP